MLCCELGGEFNCKRLAARKRRSDQLGHTKFFFSFFYWGGGGGREGLGCRLPKKTCSVIWNAGVDRFLRQLRKELDM